MPAGIKSFFIPGPSGRLEALLNQGNDDATHAALICHPHPLHGGTMHNKVVFHAMKTLQSFGFPVLRFNFRGVGMSEGQHDKGRGEVDDVRAGLDWLQSEYRLPIIFGGFSFGAAVGLRAVCGDSRVGGVISLGTPVAAEERVYTFGYLASCTVPKLFVSGSHDLYSSRANLEKLMAITPEPKELVIVEGTGHFFEGHLQEMQAAIRDWTARFFHASTNVEAS